MMEIEGRLKQELTKIKESNWMIPDEVEPIFCDDSYGYIPNYLAIIVGRKEILSM